MTSTNFKVKNPIPFISSSRAQPLVTGHINKNSSGSLGGAIPVSSIIGHTIVISPSTGISAATGTLIYTLPTASQILREFGVSTDTGVPSIATGTSHLINVVNRGSFPAFIASSSTGGDGTVLSFSNAPTSNFTGTTPVGLSSHLYLEWLQVSGGVNGATGLYTIYP